MENSKTINKGRSGISEQQKKLKKKFEMMSNRFVYEFGKELGEKEHKEKKEISKEFLIIRYDSFNAIDQKDQEGRNKYVLSMIDELSIMLEIKDSDMLSGYKKAIFDVYSRISMNNELQKQEGKEMNYQVLKINMIVSLNDIIHANYVKYLNKDKVQVILDKIYSSLETIGNAWLDTNICKLFNGYLDLLIYSVKANYYEPDAPKESLEFLFESTCQRFLTTIPGQLLMLGLEDRLKGREIDETRFKFLVEKFKKEFDKLGD